MTNWVGKDNWFRFGIFVGNARKLQTVKGFCNITSNKEIVLKRQFHFLCFQHHGRFFLNIHCMNKFYYDSLFWDKQNKENWIENDGEGWL